MDYKLVTFNEKYSDRIFVATNEDEINLIGLKILRERKDAGYYYPTLELIEEKFKNDKMRLDEKYTEALSVTPEELTLLPDFTKKRIHSDTLKYYYSLETIQRENKIEKLFAEDVEKLTSLDPEKAIELKVTHNSGRKESLIQHLLTLRSKNEYEGFTIEKPESF